MKASTNSFYTITLAAYETKPMAITGSVFVCKSSTAQFTLNLDGGDDFPMEQGWQIRLPSGDYSSLIFKNSTASPITISFYSGSSLVGYNAPVDQINLAVKQAETVLKSSATTSLADGASVTLAGTYNGKPRKQIIVTNLDVASDLHVQDAAAASGAIVFPRSAWTVETSGTVIVSNPAGNPACAIRILEIFYV